MSIRTTSDFRVQLESAMGTSSSLLEPVAYDFIMSQALNELGWKLPVEDSKKSFWCIQRGRRHALDLLRIEAAHKFKYKQIHLGQRFEHYHAMIMELDNAFNEARKTDPALADLEPEIMFGLYVENGFVYDQFGNDVTKQVFFNGIEA